MCARVRVDALVDASCEGTLARVRMAGLDLVWCAFASVGALRSCGAGNAAWRSSLPPRDTPRPRHERPHAHTDRCTESLACAVGHAQALQDTTMDALSREMQSRSRLPLPPKHCHPLAPLQDTRANRTHTWARSLTHMGAHTQEAPRHCHTQTQTCAWPIPQRTGCE